MTVSHEVEYEIYSNRNCWYMHVRKYGPIVIIFLPNCELVKDIDGRDMLERIVYRSI
jgi:hypothetical protein